MVSSSRWSGDGVRLLVPLILIPLATSSSVRLHGLYIPPIILSTRSLVHSDFRWLFNSGAWMLLPSREFITKMRERANKQDGWGCPQQPNINLVCNLKHRWFVIPITFCYSFTAKHTMKNVPHIFIII
jgi:hypothetical protein